MRIPAVVTVLTLLALPLAAQGMQPVGLRHLADQRPPAPAVRFDSIPQTHWATGAVVGMALGLIVANGLRNLHRALCESSSCGSTSPMVYIAPTMVFGIIGGMIGSSSHTKPRRALESGHDTLTAHRR